MSNTPESAPKSLSSIALQSLVAKSAKLLLLTTTAGAIIAIGLSAFQHARWTAKMTVQIGQVTNPSTVGPDASKLIEPQLTVADRYNLPTFRLDVLKSMGLPAPESDNEDSALVFDSLRAMPAKSLDLINVQVSGSSREQALKALEASFKALSAEHDKVYLPAVNRMKADLAGLSTNLSEAERDYQHAYAALNSSNREANVQNLFAANVVSQINTRILALRQSKQQLEDSLASVRTYPTRALGDYYVPPRPSSPGKIVYGAAGACIGLILGFLIALARNTRRA